MARDERDDLIDQLLAALMRAGGGLGAGALQGATMGFGDELGFMDRGDLQRTREEAPVAMSVGEALGSLPYGFLGSKLARMGEGGASRYALAAGLGAAHGAAAGLGAGEMEDPTMQDRLLSAGIGAGLGGAVGGLAVPGARGARELEDNLPALMGRVRDAETEQFGRIGEAAFGQGTRKSAPLHVELMGEGTPQEKADRALRAALQLDEADAMRASKDGAQVLGRFADEGKTYKAFDSSKVGRSTTGLVDYASQSPAGSVRLNEQADELVRKAVEKQMKATKVAAAEPVVGDGKMASADVRDLMEAFDTPAAHKSWLKEVGALDDLQREALGKKVLQTLKKRAKAAGRSEAEGFRAILRSKEMKAKLDALGIDTVGLTKNPIEAPALQKRVDTLRTRATPQANPRYTDPYKGMANPADRDLARRGSLTADDALALLEASQAPRRAYLVQPDSQARLLQGRYEAGTSFRPRQWFEGASSEDLEKAIIASQSVAAGLHGAPHWFGPRGERKKKS